MPVVHWVSFSIHAGKSPRKTRMTTEAAPSHLVHLDGLIAMAMVIMTRF